MEVSNYPQTRFAFSVGSRIPRTLVPRTPTLVPRTLIPCTLVPRSLVPLTAYPVTRTPLHLTLYHRTPYIVPSYPRTLVPYTPQSVPIRWRLYEQWCRCEEQIIFLSPPGTEPRFLGPPARRLAASSKTGDFFYLSISDETQIAQFEQNACWMSFGTVETIKVLHGEWQFIQPILHAQTELCCTGFCYTQRDITLTFVCQHWQWGVVILLS
jgi:hypothetical protein